MKKTIFLLVIFVLLFTGCNNKSNNISNVESSSSQNSEINSQIQENFTNVTKESFTNEIEIMFENCKNMNINTIIAQVRPFGDALYNSKIFPTSHLITGVQGDEILYDPLEIMVEKAHEKNLKIEAWVNPYRIQLTQNKPKELASNNKAIIYMENNENIKLYIGLGAYRIDAGDGSYKESDEWQTGNNISNMISDAIINNANGIALYRYDFLFKNTEYNELAKQEVENIGNSIK